MQWFRSYIGTHSDPKFATIAKKTGLHRTMVLSVWLAIEEFASASKERGSIAGIDMDDVAAALDMEAEQVQAIIVAFKAKGMITEADVLAAWEKRQFQSDDVTGRVRRHREMKRFTDVTETVPDETVTPPDTDTDTEQKTKGARAPRFEIPDWIPSDAWKAFEEMRQRVRKPMTNKAREILVCKLGELKKSGCDPGAVLLQSVENSWQSVYPLKAMQQAANGQSPWDKLPGVGCR